jgi:hypothetical protein
VIESRLDQAQNLAGECLSAIPVLDTQLLPHFRPGDRLLPVSCTQRRPRFGEFVVVTPADRDAPLEVARFVGLFPRRRPRSLLTWRGTRYRHDAPAMLRGRILSAQRDGRSWDLSLPRRWRLFAPLLVPAHRALAALQRTLDAWTGQRSGGVGRSVGNR